MFCSKCGKQLADQTKFCNNCGNQVSSGESSTPQAQVAPVTAVVYQVPNNTQASAGGGVGYSHRINDPAFSKYIKNSNKYALIFAIGLAIIAIIGFTIAGENSSEMDNPESFFIGCGIGGMFILIAVFQVIGKKRSKSWDGQVVDKRIEEKTRQRGGNDEDSSYTERYTEFTVFLRSQEGKSHKIRVENDATLYNYYTIGDHVRFHGGLNTYEKHDKSRDSVIFCNACSSKCDIHDEFCFRCKCPLLKF